MFFLSFAKHSVELVVALFVLYVGFVTLIPGAKALNEFVSLDSHSSTHNQVSDYQTRYFYRFGRAAFRSSSAMIRPSRLK